MPIPTWVLMDENEEGIYEKASGRERRAMGVDELDELPLTDEDNKEIPVYDWEGYRIPRKEAVLDEENGPCGVLMNLANIQAFFSSAGRREAMYDDDTSNSDEEAGPGKDKEATKVEGYPLAFLRTVGNLQATGAPHCLTPTLRTINERVRKAGNGRRHGTEDSSTPEDSDGPTVDTGPVLTATSSQFYNLVAHRMAPRAGMHDSQQGVVTAALAGAFAHGVKDRNTAKRKRTACDDDLPSARFHQRIHMPDCPKACRAEVVYTVDIRKLRTPTGRYEGDLISDG
jgi:hypothetical protein